VFDAGLQRDAANGYSSSYNSRPLISEQNAVMESRVNGNNDDGGGGVGDNNRPTKAAVACNVIPPAGTHLPDSMTSSVPSPLLGVYVEALAWLRQLHAMCAVAADRPFPLPLPLPPTSPEPAYYVTKMAAAGPPMQPFDPRWASCPSPSRAPCVAAGDPPAARDPRHGDGGAQVGGRGRDFSIPSLLSHVGRRGPSSTGADSDAATTESNDERCRSTSSSVDDAFTVEQRHLMTSSQYDVMTSRVPADFLSHQRRRQHDKQQYECPHCNKVCNCMQ